MVVLQIRSEAHTPPLEVARKEALQTRSEAHMPPLEGGVAGESVVELPLDILWSIWMVAEEA